MGIPKDIKNPAELIKEAEQSLAPIKDPSQGALYDREPEEDIEYVLEDETDTDSQEVETSEGEDLVEVESTTAQPEKYEFVPAEAAEAEKKESAEELTKKIFNRLEELSPNLKPPTEAPQESYTDSDDEEDKVYSKIRDLEKQLAAFQSNNEEIQKKSFLANVSDRSREVFPNNSLEEITNSQQFESYMEGKIFGVPRRRLLKSALDERDTNATIEILQEFKKSLTVEKNQPSLEDIETPEKSVSEPVKKRRKVKVSFKASDLSKKSEQYGRREISQEAFSKFQAEFHKALREGRVALNS